MSMYESKDIQKAVDTAEEFIRRAKIVIGEIDSNEWHSNKSTASLRRQSMELTHDLVALRSRD